MSEATTGVPAAKLSVRTMPNDSPPSDGAASTSAASSAARFSASDTRPSTVTPVRSTSSGATSDSDAPTIVSRAGTWPRSASNARSRIGSPLRSRAWPTKTISSGSPGARTRAGGAPPSGSVDAVGHDPVLAAVEPPAGPRGGVGDGDPDRKPVELAPGAHQVGDGVRRRALRIAVERADQRHVGRCERVPADRRRDGLVHVDDVELPGAQLAPQLRRPRTESPRGSRPRRSRASRSCRRAGPATPARYAAAGGFRGAATRCGDRRGRRGRARALRALRRAIRRPVPRCGAAPRRGKSTSMER